MFSKYAQALAFIFYSCAPCLLFASENRNPEISQKISPSDNPSIADAKKSNATSSSTQDQTSPYYKEFNPHIDVTPTARGCPQSSGLYLSGSFIYWKSQLEKEDVIEKNTFKSDPITFKIKQKEVNFKYAPGFKLGAGYNFKRDFWDVFFNWTSLRSTKSHIFLDTKLNLVDQFKSIILYMPITVPGEDAFIGGSIDAHWKLDFNVLDFEIGRNCFIGRNLSIRPFVGAKASWIKWKFKNEYDDFFNGSEITPLGPIESRLKENNEGIGPRIGFNSRWILSSSNFSLFANLATSLLWTDMKAKKALQVAEFGENPLTTETLAHRHELKPTIEYLMGLDWSHCFSKRFNFYISAGYEMQLWWDQTATDLNFTPLFFNGEFHANQALMLHGLTASLRLDF